MQSILETVYEYQSLLSRRAHLGIALTEEERAHFVGLRRLLRGDWLEVDDKRHERRLPESASVEFTTPGGFGRGELRDVCGGGVAITSDWKLRPGMRTLLRIRDEARNDEFVFPGRVVWRSARVIGVAFDGMPMRSGWGEGLESRSTLGRLGLGPRRGTPMVA